ncbi:30S ribosomal protein S10 [Candidatus Uhrbacteria bacterium]|nr:30S ribosomal protein S10 [Candidatus Uhrbacteria bacterium]
MADTTKTSKRATRQTGTEEEHPRIRIKIRAYDHKIVDESVRTIVECAKRTGAHVRGPVPLPTERKRYTVNRSPFVDKDARDQYELRVHKRLLDIMDPTPKTVEALQSLTLPSGVNIEVKM